MSSGSVVIFKADGDTNHKLVAQYSPSDAAVMIILGPNHYCWVTENATVKTILDPDSSIDVSPIEAYRYSCIQALDGIRLIRIQPGNWDDDIRLTLLDTRLSESDIHYEALSYTWGNCKDRVLVFCGQERHGLLVTRNCEAALRRLRHTREVRTIWIDAICINQRDDGERNAQVRQMGRIYAGASRVLVYLGEHSGDSVVAMNCLKKRSDRYRLYDKDLSSGERKALRCLLARPWFNRVWVIQEVVMARTVEAICGSHLVPWSALENLVYDMDLEPADLRLKPPRILYISMQSTSRARTLWHLLCGSRYCASTDPKDKYFALLSITSSGGFPDVDYSKDVASLYTEIALYLLNNIGLDFLPAVQCCSKPNLDTPMDIASWVPDWSQQIDLGEIFYSNCPFDAGYSRRHFVEVIPSRSNGNEGRTQPQLKVRGTRIGRIEHVHSPGFPHCAHSQQPYIINLEESHDSPFSSVLVADRLQPYINALEAFHAPFHPISMTLRPGLYTNPLNKFHASFSSILTTDATKVLYKDGEGSLRPAYMESQEIYLVSSQICLNYNAG